ncbi:MAG: hypothetical protein KIH08_00290 [Candidatus Freyarchaeota archaeon]|nr:hypothetical protein [Candidatus Jordarchaeia archaeon]MBS7268312.1 hypothetical protein [Candidatus Jordarchaeia archaeon]MBS7278311.1 hypothetical protein [Candidatus Jordarchaeia archaeon]
MSKNSDDNIINGLEFQKKKEERHPNILEGLIGIYLCYFHETKGHLALFTCPESLKNDLETLRIIQKHPVWWLGADDFKEGLNRVDLEFGGKVYAATKFKAKSAREKQRAGMSPETEEVFVLIVSVPVGLAKPLGDKLLSVILQKIRESLQDKLYLLIEKDLACCKPIRTQEDNKIIKDGEEIENNLLNICEISIPIISSELMEALQSDVEKQRNLIYFLLSNIYGLSGPQTRSVPLSGKSAIETRAIEHIPESPIELVGVEFTDNKKKLKITVKNNSEKGLENIKISIAHIEEFFETYSWDTTVEIWFPYEELVFQYPRVDRNGEYILKIEDRTNKLLIKRISIKEMEKP